MAPRVPMPAQDWTLRAPKWAAVALLGVLCAVALIIGGVREYRSWRPATLGMAAQPQPLQPVLAKAPTQTDISPIADASSQPASDVSTKASEPRSGSPPTSPANSAKPSSIPSHLVNVNTASASELELLPGIGPALARRIIDHRTARGPFKRLSDLDAVKGIGPKLLERIRSYAVVE